MTDRFMLDLREDVWVTFWKFAAAINAKTADEALTELLVHVNIEVIKDCRSEDDLIGFIRRISGAKNDSF